MIVAILIIAMVITAVLSGEHFRRGALADWDEIHERNQEGGGYGCTATVVWLLAAGIAFACMAALGMLGGGL